MGNNLNGLVKFKTEDVYRACQACLDKRAARIAEEREHMVQNLMDKIQVKFWSRRRYSFTREEAIEYLKNDDTGLWTTRWREPELQGSGAANDIAELWHAAKAAGRNTEMFISALNAARLLDFIKPQEI